MTQPAVAAPHNGYGTVEVPAGPSVRRRRQGLSYLVHAPAKAGKSTIADSGPRPRLILDVEGTSVWTPTRKTEWNPDREPPPHLDRHVTAGYGQPSVTASWESCIVMVREAATLVSAYRVLNSGNHPFNSLSMDSVTEAQQRLIDKKAGTKKVERDHWGELLREVSAMVRQYRDLITHPTHPLWSVTFVAGTHQHQGKWRPLVQGQAQNYLPYYVDVEGYLFANQDGTRDLLIGPHNDYETGERVGGRLPYAARLAYPGKFQGWTVESMVQHVLSTS